MCNFNKDWLLTLFFHEGSAREEREIQGHVDGCEACRNYMLTLAHTDEQLLKWEDAVCRRIHSTLF